MKIDESNYDVFYKLQNKGFNIDIIWKDAENIEGYIEVEKMYNLIQDLKVELEVKEEKYNDLKDKINQKIDKVNDAIFIINMLDKWDSEDRLAWNLRNQQLKDLQDLQKES